MLEDEKNRSRPTDPTGHSRKREFEVGDNEHKLNRVDSPEPMDSDHTDDFNRPSDKASSTEVPSSNQDHTSTGYQAKDGSEEKHGMRSKLPKFLGGTGKKEEHDDNNGKEKQKFTVWGQLRATIFGSWVNVLLIACKFA